MKLAELNAHWVTRGDGGRFGVEFVCPACVGKQCADAVRIFFENPLDGAQPAPLPCKWQRTGDTLDTLTLRPSIDVRGASDLCDWHGYITNGEATKV